MVPTGATSQQSSDSGSQGPSAQSGPTGWTVMAYMAGDNNLSEKMVDSLQHIHQQALRPGKPLWPNIKVFAQFDPSALGIPTQRYWFVNHAAAGTPKGPNGLITHLVDPPKNFNETNTGNPGALAGFIRWALAGGSEDDPSPQANGSQYHALVLSGHGSGATEDFLLIDENDEDSLSIPELAQALLEARVLISQARGVSLPCLQNGESEQIPTVHRLRGSRELRDLACCQLEELRERDARVPKIDLLGMDACFMSMIEVCWEIQDHVELLVGAEGFEPEFGWPYQRILEALAAHREEMGRTTKPDEAAAIIVRQYVEHYADFESTVGGSVDLAAIRVNRIASLKEPLTQLAAALSNALEDRSLVDAVVGAHWEAQTFKFHQYVDLRDFCMCLRERLKGREGEAVSLLRSACEAVRTSVEHCVLLAGCSGFEYQHSYGLSIYLPWAEAAKEYENLRLARQVGWGDMIKKYVSKTQRQRRKDLQKPEPSQALQGAVDCLATIARGEVEKRLRRDVLAGARTGAGELPAGHRYGNRTKYARLTKYNHRTKYGFDREQSVKNFAPATGKAFWPS